MHECATVAQAANSQRLPLLLATAYLDDDGADQASHRGNDEFAHENQGGWYKLLFKVGKERGKRN